MYLDAGYGHLAFCFPDLKTLVQVDQSGAKSAIVAQALAFRKAILTGCHDEAGRDLLAEGNKKTFLPLHNQ